MFLRHACPVIYVCLEQAGLRFTTSAGREQFSRLVLHQIRPIDKVMDLANLLDQRMLAVNSGRMWVAAHMRRGDCVLISSYLLDLI